MKAAILNLVDRVSEDGLPRGCLPVADGLLILLQIDVAKRFGAEEIFCLVDNPPTEIIEIEAYAERLGMRFTLARTAADISVKVGADDELLMVADGLFVAPSEAAVIGAPQGPRLVSFAPEDQADMLAAGFERIDINHVWAGLAVLKGSDVFEARSLPEDWNVQSMLLRIAVQRSYRREVKPVSSFTHQSLALPISREQSMALGTQLIGGPSQIFGDFDSHIWSNPIAQPLARKIWDIGLGQPLLRAASFGLPVLCLVLANYEWIVTGFILLILARLACGAMRSLHGHFAGRRAWRYDGPVADGLTAIAFIALLYCAVSPELKVVSGFAGLMMVGLVQLVRLHLWASALPKGVSTPRILASSLLFLGIGAVAAAFGILLVLTMAWCLAALGWLLFRTQQSAPKITGL